MREVKAKKCFGCAALGDCPNSTVCENGCKYFVPYRISHDNLSSIIGVSRRTLFRWLDHKAYVKAKLKTVGIVLHIKDKGKRRVLTVKIPYEELLKLQNGKIKK